MIHTMPGRDGFLGNTVYTAVYTVTEEIRHRRSEPAAGGEGTDSRESAGDAPRTVDGSLDAAPLGGSVRRWNAAVERPNQGWAIPPKSTRLSGPVCQRLPANPRAPIQPTRLLEPHQTRRRVP